MNNSGEAAGDGGVSDRTSFTACEDENDGDSQAMLCRHDLESLAQLPSAARSRSTAAGINA
jgi:hypothetical protein